MVFTRISSRVYKNYKILQQNNTDCLQVTTLVVDTVLSKDVDIC